MQTTQGTTEITLPENFTESYEVPCQLGLGTPKKDILSIAPSHYGVDIYIDGNPDKSIELINNAFLRYKIKTIAFGELAGHPGKDVRIIL
ncbi:MAG: hypothetical protein ABII18_11770, partial [bacterium]